MDDFPVIPVIEDLFRFLDNSSVLKALIESPLGPAVLIGIAIVVALIIVIYLILGIIYLATKRTDELADRLAESRVFWRWLGIILGILAVSATWHHGVAAIILAGFAAVGAVATVRTFFRDTRKKHDPHPKESGQHSDSD